MRRVIVGLALTFGFCVAADATAMKASAPDKMMPSGGGDVMRECEHLAAKKNIKMEERAQFVKDCAAKKMK